jgi:hypothetical protein
MTGEKKNSATRRVRAVEMLFAFDIEHIENVFVTEVFKMRDQTELSAEIFKTAAHDLLLFGFRETGESDFEISARDAVVFGGKFLRQPTQYLTHFHCRAKRKKSETADNSAYGIIL